MKVSKITVGAPGRRRGKARTTTVRDTLGLDDLAVTVLTAGAGTAHELNLLDPVTVADQVVDEQSNQHVAIDDTVALADVADAVRTVGGTAQELHIDDTLALLDLAVRQETTRQAVVDTVPLADLLTTLLTQGAQARTATVSDALGLSDQLTANLITGLQGSLLPAWHVRNIVATYYVDGVAGSDTTGDGSQAHPWKTPQHAADQLETAITWPVSGDVRVKLGPAGYLWRGADDTPATLSLNFTVASGRSPRADRWLIWEADQGQVTIENPRSSAVDVACVYMADTDGSAYTIFDGIRFYGGDTPKGVAGHNGASIGLWIDGNANDPASNGHDIEVWNYELDGFKQTDGATFESGAAIFQNGANGNFKFINGRVHDIATLGGGGAGIHGFYIHAERDVLFLNLIAYRMNHGFVWQMYNSTTGMSGNGTIASHMTLVDCSLSGANGGTILYPERDSDLVIVNSIMAHNAGPAAMHIYQLAQPFTADPATDRCTKASHGLRTDSKIQFTTTGTLPAPLVAGTTYYAIRIDSATFKVAATPGGPAINLLSAGSGTNKFLGVQNRGDHLVFYANTGGDYETSPGWAFTSIRTGTDPKFVDYTNHDLRLQAGSNALGYSDTRYSPDFDVDGNARVEGLEDAGAYQR